MNHIFDNKTRGRVLFSEGEIAYKSVQNSLLKSIDGGITWEIAFILPLRSVWDRLAYFNNLACRLLRKGIHHFNVGPSNKYGILFNKSVMCLDSFKSRQESPLIGSRPLSFESINNEFVFGEYRSNPTRTPVHIFGINTDTSLCRKLRMSGIRHVHGVYHDPYINKIWVTTGDFDEESSLYCMDLYFENVEKILSGSQQTRTIKLLFTESFVYFGSDAPDEINYIYRFSRKTKQVECLAQVGSSVFHGTKVGDWLFFSTAIEPSTVNKTKYAEIWCSPNGSDWKPIFKFKKDIWSMKFFQYGQIYFPNGKGDNSYLWFSPYATACNNLSFKIAIGQITNLFNKSKCLKF